MEPNDDAIAEQEHQRLMRHRKRASGSYAKRRQIYRDNHVEAFMARGNVVAAIDGDRGSIDPENLFKFQSRTDWVRAKGTLWALLPALFAAGAITFEHTDDPVSGAPSIRYVIPQAPTQGEK